MSERLVDLVTADARSHKPAGRSFMDRLPHDQQAELCEVRALWQSGATGVTITQMSKIVHARCVERGVKVCGEDGLRKWLMQKNS